MLFLARGGRAGETRLDQVKLCFLSRPRLLRFVVQTELVEANSDKQRDGRFPALLSLRGPTLRGTRESPIMDVNTRDWPHPFPFCFAFFPLTPCQNKLTCSGFVEWVRHQQLYKSFSFFCRCCPACVNPRTCLSNHTAREVRSVLVALRRAPHQEMLPVAARMCDGRHGAQQTTRFEKVSWHNRSPFPPVVGL